MRKESRRTFWQGVAVNFFLFALGILIGRLI